ncbi:tetratricopeptide repeat protein [candidate division KSB1 bacterium]|nr:tetratricopeptide repeat protein [candidate division KSB1 bacterium]RQW10221.1 MAG: outer membrane protein assembly factor BamD [candidate division KSB1 bacterium]
MKRLIWIYSLLFTFILSGFLIFSCAGNQAGAYGEEELYPGETMTDDQAASSDEDEVLRLLGIKDEQVETEPPTTETKDEQQILQDEIGRLESEVTERDRQLASLKNQLEEKDAQIQAKSQTLTQITVPTGTSFKSRYDDALRLYYSRRYNDAIFAFDQLLASGENNSLSDNCQYWKGECYYGLGNYNQAIMEFQKVFNFPNSNKLDDAQLKLGLCYIQLNDKAQAKREFEKLLKEHPTSEYAGRAQSHLGQL